MIGKTIKSVVQKKLKDYDDKGFLEIKFTDETSVAIVASYIGYTGNSVDEYTTNIEVTSKMNETSVTCLGGEFEWEFLKEIKIEEDKGND